jgi:intracellular septation protein
MRLGLAVAGLSAMIRGHFTPPRADMQALSDFFPVLAFVIAYYVAGIYVATGVLIAATVAQVALTWARTRTLSKMALISAGLVLLLGGLTLVLHNELLIMWKPTVLYAVLAVALLVSQYVGDKPLVERLLGHQLRTDARTWKITNLSWAAFFLLLAGVNLIFVYRYGLEVWVRWKAATIGLVFAFAIGQALWLAGRAEHAGGGS